MKIAQTIRILTLLALIFAAGFVTGRLTMPRQPTLIPRFGGRFVTVEVPLARLVQDVGLDTAQQQRVRPLLEEMAEKVARQPPASVQRRDIFRSYVPRVREVLRPEQYAKFDQYVAETERRFERAIRTRSGQ